MGRLRARLSHHQVDRDAGKRLAEADRSLRLATASYQSALKGGSPAQQRRAKSSIDVIRKALSSLAGVQSVGDHYDGTDPDLMPESNKVVRPRKRKSERVE